MLTLNNAHVVSVSCSRLRAPPPPLATFADAHSQFPQPSPESVLVRGGVGRRAGLRMRALHRRLRASRNARSIRSVVDPVLINDPAARETFRSVTPSTFARSANPVLRSAGAVQAPAPNPRFEGTRCQRGCFSFTARRFHLRCGRAPQPARWAPESNSPTQPVGAIGSGRRIMAT